MAQYTAASLQSAQTWLPQKECKESLEEIVSSMVFAQIQTCISFHEMGHACACVHSRVHVYTHRAVSVAPLAESYLVFAASECCMCHGEVRGIMLSITTGRGRPTMHAFVVESILFVFMQLCVCVRGHSCARRCTCLHSSTLCRCRTSKVLHRCLVRAASCLFIVIYLHI